MQPSPQLPKNIARILQAIAADKTSGASTLFDQALTIFPLLAESIGDDRRKTRAVLLQLAANLWQAQPMMAPFAHLSLYLQRMAERRFDSQVLHSAFHAFPHAARRTIQKGRKQIVATACELLSEYQKILVHSNSSLVAIFLREWLSANPDREIWLTESRPMQEGIALARALADLPNRKVVLVDDARGLALAHIDAVVVGADQVSEYGMTNKIGTKALALLAEQAGKPGFVLADFIKFLPAKIKTATEPAKPGWEIAPDDLNLDCFNFYFETTPLHHFTKIITPLGATDAAGIGDIFHGKAWDVFALDEEAA